MSIKHIRAQSGRAISFACGLTLIFSLIAAPFSYAERSIDQEQAQITTPEILKMLEKELATDSGVDHWRDTARSFVSLHCKLAEQELQAGEYESAMMRLESLTAILNRLDDKALQALVAWHLAESYRVMGYNQKALDAYQQVLASPESKIFQSNQVDLLAAMGQIYFFQKEYEKAEESLKQSIALANSKRLQNPAALKSLGMLRLHEKAFAEAEIYTKQALSQAKRVHGSDSVAWVPYMQSLGLIYIAEKRYAKAEAIYQQSLKRLRHHRNLQASIASYNNLGLVYHCQSDFTRAKYYYEKAYAIELDLNLNVDSPNYQRTIAHLKEIAEKRPPSLFWEN